MYDALLVKVVKCLEKVPHDADCIFLLVEALRFDPLEEFSSLEIFKNQVNVLIALIDLVKLNNVLVVDGSQDVYLA